MPQFINLLAVETDMYTNLQAQINAAVAAKITICLGIAPLKNPCADFKGGTCTMMADGTINYTPPHDKLNS